MQYLVLLPGLALVDRGELFIQSRTWLAKMEPAQNDAQKEDQTGTGKSTSALQRAQANIARDEDPSGHASKLCLNRSK